MRENIDKFLWITSLLFFLAGITLPMFSMEKLLLFKDTFSLLGGLYQLLKHGEFFLFLLIFIFSIVMPICKFGFGFNYLFQHPSTQALKLRQIKKIAAIGKWSMADVFVISVLAATVKIGGFAHVTVHIGLLIFGLSVLLSLALSHRLMSHYELKPKNELSKTSS